MNAPARYSLLVLTLATLLQLTSTSLAALLTLGVWYLLGGKRTLYLIYHTGWRDFQMATRFIHLLWVNLLCKLRDQSVGDLFLKTAARVPDKVMITMCHDSGADKMTFREVQEKACRVARYFQSQGFSKGDVVGLVLENRVDYCCYWLGLSFIGVIPALINCNLRKQSLLHTVTVAKCKAVVFSSELAEAISEVQPELGPDTLLYSVDRTTVPDSLSLSDMLPPLSGTPLSSKMAGYDSPFLYIYTSGTTGLPKAAVLKHSRFMFAVFALYYMTRVRSDDVLYSPLPLYHTAAGVMVTGSSLTRGVTMVTRRKFSARNFWSDCAQHGATCAQYIGEIARYLYTTPVCEEEKRHQIRMMFGNGLRPQIWKQFTDRFGIKQINEFYGSTEGNCSVGNFSNKVGAVGFISVLFPALLPLGLVRVDENTREPVRDPDTGLAVPCGYGQDGELVGKIEKGHPVRDFHGYADKSATKKKVMTDVWRKGDMGFRSGDIMVMDELGWLYFKDRAGDTFRWKGENVSTMEVEATISSVVGLQDSVVYGVEIPGTEGRAGMAAIPDPESSLDMEELYRGVEEKLPPYARPMFVRKVTRIEVTATYKLKKRDLQREGFNPDTIADPLFMLDTRTKTYLPLTREQYNNIINGNIKI